MSAHPELYLLPALLPCPFCGRPVTLKRSDGALNLYVFACEAGSPCIGSGIAQYALGSKLDTAIKQWNTRS